MTITAQDHRFVVYDVALSLALRERPCSAAMHGELEDVGVGTHRNDLRRPRPIICSFSGIDLIAHPAG